MMYAFAGAVAALVITAQGLAAQGTVPTASREIARGVELTAADITGDTAVRIGWVTRRVIHEGEKLVEPSVVPPQYMRAGAAVTVRFESAGVIVTRQGTALANASLGNAVRVRVDSQHIVTGVVAGSAIVTVR